MPIMNTEDQYGLVHKIFHWLIAIMIIGLLPVGLFMGGMDNSPFKFQVFALHKSFGLLVFFLGLLRIVWRFISPVPDHLETHQKWETALAGAAHFWLYVCMIGMPLSGWVMSSAQEFPIPFFGVQMPGIVGKDEQLGELAGTIHEILAYTLLFVLGLHIAGALKHHVLDKDDTLKRMSWKKAGIGLAAAIVVIVGASYAFSGAAILKDLIKSDEQAVAEKPVITAPVPPESTTDTAGLPDHGWAIVKEKTRLSFKASLYKAEFEGVFNDVTGTIVFNPDDLAKANADIRIGMKDITTGDSERDSNIQGVDWFDSDNYPQSRFQSVTFEKGVDGKYVAIGNLTIRGVTLPVSIPFNLSITNKTAVMKAEITLNRLDFNVGGSEQWKDESTIGHTIKVLIDLTAVQ